MDKMTLFNTRQIAQFLHINEKMVYSLISEKGLPATKRGLVRCLTGPHPKGASRL
jgi:hypothetical protein